MLMNELECVDQPYKDILKMLYVNCQSWKDVCHRLDISTSTCSRYRKQGINIILENINNRKEVICADK